MSARSPRIAVLYQRRPTQYVVWGSLMGMMLAMAGTWVLSDVSVLDLLEPRRLANLERFMAGVGPGAGVAWSRWLHDGLDGRLGAAVWPTVALAVFSIAIAGFVAAVLSLASASRLMTPEPWLPASQAPGLPRVVAWRLLLISVRLVLMLGRGIPTYLWAYLLVMVFGLGAWPAALALIFHNTGILGRLGGELVDDLDSGASLALRGMGATRGQIAVLSLMPAALGRALLFFFVRWETAVREATVLGLLGFVSLGWFIQDARVRMQVDQMMIFVGLGVLIVMVGDGLSIWVRRWVRMQ